MIRAFTTVFQGTLLSRMSGMLRDTALAFAFGTSATLAAYFVAFRFAFLLRRLFGEALVSAVFIPHFSRIKEQDPLKAEKFYGDFFMSVFVMVLSVVFAFELAFFYCDYPIITHMKILLPALVFLSLYAVNSAFLQCQGVYFLPAIAPLFCNLTVTFFCLFFQKRQAFSLSGASLMGFGFQWLSTQLAIMYFWGFSGFCKRVVSWRPFSKVVRALYAPFILGTLGISTTQINSFLDAVFARYIDIEGPTYLWFSIRLEQLPLALFGLALSTAYFPQLAKRIDQSIDGGLWRFSLEKVLKYGSLLMVFSTVGLLFFGKEAVSCLYERGSFGEGSVDRTSFCLYAYSLGLFPAFYTFLATSVFHAQKRYVLPLQGAAFATAINAVFNVFFTLVFRFSVASVAFATALSQWLGAWFLWRKVPAKTDMSYVAKVVFAALSSAFAASLCQEGLGLPQVCQSVGITKKWMISAVNLGAGSMFYGIFFMIWMRALHIKELEQILLRRVGDEFTN